MSYMMINMNKIIKRIISIIKNNIFRIIYFNKIKIGKKVVFYKNNCIIIEKNGFVSIGNNCFFNRNCSINSMKRITIGDNCIFGENVCIYDHNHKYNNKSIIIKKQGYSLEEVSIGDNCWIGSNVVILKGVCIGDNVVIGAGSIITKNIPNNSVVYNKNEMIIKGY